jgi:hypothetical protein
MSSAAATTATGANSATPGSDRAYLGAYLSAVNPTGFARGYLPQGPFRLVEKVERLHTDTAAA